MATNKLPPLPMSPYIISEWAGPEMTSRKSWTAYTEDDLRAYAVAYADSINSEFAALLPGPYYMDPPDGGDVTVIEQLRRMAEDAAKFRQSQSLPAGAVAFTQPVYSLARKLLWLAYVWNDHNFDAAHVEARQEAQRFGIDSFDSANEWLEKQNELIDRTLQADAREKGEALALTAHARRALEGCIREHQKFIELADDYDLDEMSVQALQTGIESMQMRLATQPAQASEKDSSSAFRDELDEIRELRTHPQPVTPAGEHFPGGDIGVGSYAQTEQFRADSPAVTPAGGVPFSTVREVVKALTRLGTSTPESQEEQAARAVELIGWLCREVHSHFDELSKVAPAGGEVADAAVLPVDHAAALSLAIRQQTSSNLARCYIDIVATEAAKIEPAHPPVADAALVRDAERYRWLRNPDNGEGSHWTVYMSADELDAAIDAALNQRGGGGNG